MSAHATSRPPLAPLGGTAARIPLRALGGYGSLAVLVAASTYLALAAAARLNFLVPANPTRLPGWLAGPFHGTAATLTGRGYVLLLGAMVAAYLVALACRIALRGWVVVATVLALHAIFLLAPPLLSGDIFSYVAYARMGVLHAVDPYAHGPGAIHGDPVVAFTHWRQTASVYGPLFTLLSYPTAWLGVAGAMWALKALAAVSSLGTIALVWATARRLGRDPVAPTLLVGLNPVLLVFSVGGGHNDLLMLGLAVAAVYLVVAGRDMAAGASVVAAAAVKVSSVVVAPFVLAGARRRPATVGGAVAGLAAVGLVTVIAFGSDGLGFVTALERHQNLVSAASWPATLSGAFADLPDLAVPGRLLTVAVAGWLAWRAWTGRTDWIAGAGWTLLALAVTSPWLLAWYTEWPLPFAALTRDRRLIAATLFTQALFLAHRIPAVAG